MPQTIFVTGATGYIARHIVQRLLARGHKVVGSTRSLTREGELRAALEPALADPALLGNLTLVALDMTSDEGWAGAMQGADALIHTASPFPLSQPKDPQELIAPAVGGATRAIAAAKAAGVGRVVMTSSVAAVISRPMHGDGSPYTEADWTDVDDPSCSAYSASKTLAERAAWDAVEGTGIALTTINPGFVIGPPLGSYYASSVSVVERILSGKDPLAPRIGLDTVDVRDVAEAHIRALERPAAAGERIIAVDRYLWFAEMGRALNEAYPARRIATRVAPDVLIRLIGLFDKDIRSVLPILGEKRTCSNEKARRLLEIDFIDSRQSLIDTAEALLAAG